jgi:hypothetical protein
VKVIVPGADNAYVDVAKLRDYCLNPMHPRGKHKARVFASALNLSCSDAEWLRVTLLQAAQRIDAIATETDAFGIRYIIDFDCINGDKSARIRSAWIIRVAESFPRFLTCYVLSE